ncbi:hypothetical protein [Arthrobacter luteolus]|uniref:hypothetical protein n=1 Tax=Arthrobacter luteolus TaxID=98672 RepID=UPI00384C3C7A
MSKVTTLPYMEVVDESGVRDDWFRLYCELCEYHTPAGSFYNCEMEAADHLDAEHGEERKRADAERLAKWREYQAEK